MNNFKVLGRLDHTLIHIGKFLGRREIIIHFNPRSYYIHIMEDYDHTYHYEVCLGDDYHHDYMFNCSNVHECIIYIRKYIKYHKDLFDYTDYELIDINDKSDVNTNVLGFVPVVNKYKKEVGFINLFDFNEG